MRHSDFHVGSLVMLKPGVKPGGKMEGREDNRFSTIASFMDTIIGGVRLSHDLRCCLYWNVDDLVVVNPAKVWNKAYRKGFVAGKNRKAKKNKAE